MHLSSLKIENFKCFAGAHLFPLTSGLNLLVGDNNSGKSTILEAIEFLRNGLTASLTADVAQNTATRETFAVTAEFQGLADQIETQEALAKLRPYVFRNAAGEKVLLVRRSGDDLEILQNGRKVRIDVKKITFWNDKEGQFENPSGIDTIIKSIVDFQPVWADTSPGDVSDFGSTKTLGRLIEALASEFRSTESWKTFEDAHKSAFGPGETGLSGHLSSLATEASEILSEQFGPTGLRFDFGLPDPSAFTKAGQVIVSDGVGETPISQKGSGLQRALALALIQIYAKKQAASGDGDARHLILMFDEPETWLHPNAQLRLTDALKTIAESEQVFLATHSPFLLRSFHAGRDSLHSMRVDDGDRSATIATELGHVTPGRPSWAEINYHAFGIATVELLNELFGAIGLHVERTTGNTTVKAVNTYLTERSVATPYEWTPPNQPTVEATASYFARNAVHHPEAVAAQEMTAEILAEAISEMTATIAADPEFDGGLVSVGR